MCFQCLGKCWRISQSASRNVSKWCERVGENIYLETKCSINSFIPRLSISSLRITHFQNTHWHLTFSWWIIYEIDPENYEFVHSIYSIYSIYNTKSMGSWFCSRFQPIRRIYLKLFGFHAVRLSEILKKSWSHGTSLASTIS